jgi:hypothetical protein
LTASEVFEGVGHRPNAAMRARWLELQRGAARDATRYIK